jgi:4-hydroxy-3-polyprenylbenzoate decarboxylase
MGGQKEDSPVTKPEPALVSTEEGRDVKKIVVGITGASGALYALRTIRMLVLSGYSIELILSEYAHYTLYKECGVELKPSTIKNVFPDLIYSESSFTFNNNLDLKSSLLYEISSIKGMVVVPCSTNYIAGIATGASKSLIEKAADIFLTYNKPLVIVPRQTPLNQIHVQNMLSILKSGGKLVPAMPEFDNIPTSFNDLADNIAKKILALLDIKSNDKTITN